MKRERERKREREGERAIATNTTNINKDIFDIQNNIVVDHFKMMLRKIIVTNFIVIFQKTQDKETIASLMRAPKM